MSNPWMPFCKCGCGREMPEHVGNGSPRSYHAECTSAQARACERWRAAKRRNKKAYDERRCELARTARKDKNTQVQKTWNERLTPREPVIVCKVCYDLPHRREGIECSGCGREPGEARATRSEPQAISALALGELWS